jgi:hypothetical protein
VQKKRLFAFSLVIGLAASFITLQVNSPRAASAQDAKAKQDGFIIGCSETVIDALDECVQKRFSKADLLFGFERMEPPSYHVNHFVAETVNERDAISELERGGWQVAFYLVGRRILGPKPDLSKPHWSYLAGRAPIINGPLAITSLASFDGRKRDDALNFKIIPFATASRVISDKKRMIEEFELPEPLKLWDDAQKAMIAFEKRDQYDFSSGKWNIAARPIRAQESCLKCHTVDQENLRKIYLEDLAAPKPAPPKVGDALGVAMYAYARKQ